MAATISFRRALWWSLLLALQLLTPALAWDDDWDDANTDSANRFWCMSVAIFGVFLFVFVAIFIIYCCFCIRAAGAVGDAARYGGPGYGRYGGRYGRYNGYGGGYDDYGYAPAPAVYGSTPVAAGIAASPAGCQADGAGHHHAGAHVGGVDNGGMAGGHHHGAGGALV